MSFIKLQSSDGEMFPMDVEIAKQSLIIKDMLENLLNDEEVVPLPNVDAFILRKVIQWLTYHKDDSFPRKDAKKMTDDMDQEMMTEDICPWDVDFLKVDQGTLFELILAANYLHIEVNLFMNEIH